jgi:IclR family pca regulon transcriptional regulator
MPRLASESRRGRRSAHREGEATEAGVPVSKRSTATPNQDAAGGADGETAEERRGRFSSSLRAGLAILNCFTAERTVLGIAMLADELNMSRSTTHRYASTLVALGYLEQDQSRRYRLAPRVADVGMAVLDSMELRPKARGPLRELREQTGRTVSLAVLDGSELRYVERLRGWRRGQHAVDMDIGAGARMPLYCTAMGKVLLAGLPEDERARLIAALELTRRGPNSITSKRALRAELEEVRAAGLAFGDEELAPGVRTLAAPIVGPDGEVVAAVGIPVPAAALSHEELREVLGPPLTAAAARISAALRD